MAEHHSRRKTATWKLVSIHAAFAVWLLSKQLAEVCAHRFHMPLVRPQNPLQRSPVAAMLILIRQHVLQLLDLLVAGHILMGHPLCQPVLQSQ